MPSFKKLTFAPIFLISYALLIYSFASFFGTYDFIFSLNLDVLINLFVQTLLFTFTAMTFVIFASLSQNRKIILAILTLGSLLPFLFVEFSTALVLVVGGLISFTLTMFNLEHRLKSYILFDESALLRPPIRSLVAFLILFFSFAYFLSISKAIATQGFQIPDSLLETLVKFTPQTVSSVEVPESMIKSLMKMQLEESIKFYTDSIPPIFGLVLYFSLQSLASFVNLFVYPILWLIFYILEKVNFIKFEVEERPVRKMVV